MATFTTTGSEQAHDIVHMIGNKDLYTITENAGVLTYTGSEHTYINSNVDVMGFKGPDIGGDSNFKFVDELSPFTFITNNVSSTIGSYITGYNPAAYLGRTPQAYFGGAQYITTNGSMQIFFDAGVENNFKVNSLGLTTDGSIGLYLSDDNSNWTQIGVSTAGVHTPIVLSNTSLKGRYMKFEGLVPEVSNYFNISSTTFGSSYAGISDFDIDILTPPA